MVDILKMVEDLNEFAKSFDDNTFVSTPCILTDAEIMEIEEAFEKAWKYDELND